MRAALPTLVFTLAACGERREAPPSPPPVAADAAVTGPDAAPPPDALFEDAAVAVTPEEAAARADRTTGLPGAGPPQVVTEILIVAMGTGRAERRYLVDPAAGVWEVTLGAAPGDDRAERRCGAAAAQLLDDNLGRLVDRQIIGRAAVTCDNQRATAAAAPPDPRAGLGRHMLCASPPANATDDGYALLFAPDADRGARLVAAVRTAPGAPLERAWPRLARALARPGRPCR
jgi:hypothetical protein